MVSCVSLTMSNLGKVWNYGKRVLEVTPELIFGSASEAMGDTFRTTSGSLFDKARAGWHTLESAGKGSFFKNLWNNFTTFIPCIKSNIQTATSAAKLAGKNTFLAGTKGFFKGIGKKMPFIGAMSMMLFELPNIWKATKEQGIFQGAAEVVKSGARLAGGGLGAAIGSALIPIPFVGSMAGWLAGEWIASKIVGKSYTQQKLEQEQQQKQQQQSQEQPQYAIPEQGQISQQPQVNPYWTNPENPQTSFEGTTDTNTYIPSPMSQIPNQPMPNLGMPNQVTTNPFAPQGFTPVVPTPMTTPSGLYNPFGTQNMPYENNFMPQQMQLNPTI